MGSKDFDELFDAHEDAYRSIYPQGSRAGLPGHEVRELRIPTWDGKEHVVNVNAFARIYRRGWFREPDKVVRHCSMCNNSFDHPAELWKHLWRWHSKALLEMPFESVMAVASVLGREAGALRERR